MEYKITHIQLFDFAEKRQIDDDGGYEIEYSYSAHLIINDAFLVEIWGNKKECGFDGIAESEYWKSEESQHKALNEIDNNELQEYLDKNGFENNIGWLSDHILVIAGPGTGKTRVMVNRVARLIKEGVSGHTILMLTFTNKAALEMKERIASLVSENEVRKIWIGTFHAIGLRILSQ